MGPGRLRGRTGEADLALYGKRIPVDLWRDIRSERDQQIAVSCGSCVLGPGYTLPKSFRSVEPSRVLHICDSAGECGTDSSHSDATCIGSWIRQPRGPSSQTPSCNASLCPEPTQDTNEYGPTQAVEDHGSSLPPTPSAVQWPMPLRDALLSLVHPQPVALLRDLLPRQDLDLTAQQRAQLGRDDLLHLFGLFLSLLGRQLPRGPLPR